MLDIYYSSAFYSTLLSFFVVKIFGFNWTSLFARYFGFPFQIWATCTASAICFGRAEKFAGLCQLKVGFDEKILENTKKDIFKPPISQAHQWIWNYPLFFSDGKQGLIQTILIMSILLKKSFRREEAVVKWSYLQLGVSFGIFSPTKFFPLLIKVLVPPIVTWSRKLRTKKSWKPEQQNECVNWILKHFLPGHINIFLEEIAIYNYKSLPQEENI